MRILLKILCAPVVAVLAVAGWFFTFLLSVSAAVLGIAAVVLGMLGLFILILDSAVNGIIVLGVASLISPYGLPMLAKLKEPIPLYEPKTHQVKYEEACR